MTTTNSATTAYQMLIDGRWTDAAGGETFDRQSPANDAVVGRYPRGTASDADAAVAAARKAFEAGPWPRTSGAERAELLLRVASLIRRDAAALAHVETRESGKPIKQARDEMGWAAGLWEYAASLARQLRGDTYNTLGAATLGFTLREPVGVVAMITPWNFPLLIVSQKLPFALAAGCACVVKPSEFTPGTTLMLGRLLGEAGLPPGVVNIVTGYGDPVGATLAAHHDVDMISFTGSTRVGRQIVAASAGNLKKVALELGGKNPQIVFADADLDSVVDAVVFGVFFNMGECCNSGSRLLVHESVADELVRRVVERTRHVKTGDPMDEATQVGAIINAQQYEKIMAYVDAGQRGGATLCCGGKPLATPGGRFIAPTVFDHVPPESPLAREEVFGPVLAVVRFKDAAEAARLANDTEYGLSASVWTRDLDTAVNMSRAVRAGTVWVNTFLEGTPELPFGGYKQSGLGRELGRFAADEYTETKTVYVHLGPRAPSWSVPASAV
ncbi:MAG TPA: aldehyde dehydrogenase family protein [Tepidisphaeraceae bacterium]|nr:aldehyde dehydrogenase family protein [Tepidisphaeraceae bacterium]